MKESSIEEQCLAEKHCRGKYDTQPGDSYGPASKYCLPVIPQRKANPSTLDEAVGSDPLSILSENKKELVLSRIVMLASQVYNRRQVREGTLHSIEIDELFCRNQALQRESMGDYAGALDIELNQLLRLHKERREDQTSYFRDTAMLNKDLIDAVLEYKATIQRKGFFDKLEQDEGVVGHGGYY